MNAKKHEQRRRWRNRVIVRGWALGEDLNGPGRVIAIWGFTPPPGKPMTFARLAEAAARTVVARRLDESERPR